MKMCPNKSRTSLEMEVKRRHKLDGLVLAVSASEPIYTDVLSVLIQGRR